MMLLFLLFCLGFSALPAGHHCNYMNSTYLDTGTGCNDASLIQFVFGILPPIMTGGYQCGVCHEAGSNSFMLAVYNGQLLKYPYTGNKICAGAPGTAQPQGLQDQTCPGWVGSLGFVLTLPLKIPTGKEWWPRTMLYNTTTTCDAVRYTQSDVYRKPDSCLPTSATTSTKLKCLADSSGGYLELHNDANCGSLGGQQIPSPCTFVQDGTKGTSVSCTGKVDPRSLPTMDCKVGVYTYKSTSTSCDMNSDDLIAVENTVFDVILASQGLVGKECGKCIEKSAFASYKLFPYSDGQNMYNATAVWTWNKDCSGDKTYMLNDTLPNCNYRQTAGAIKKVLKLGNGFDDFPTQTTNWAAANIYPSEAGCKADQAVGKARVKTGVCAGPGKQGFRKVVCTQGGATATSWAASATCSGAHTLQDVVSGSECKFSQVLDEKWLKSTKCPYTAPPTPSAAGVVIMSIAIVVMALLF